MKKVFHLCHSSKEEVLFRNHDDYNWGFNSYALALYKTESCSLADARKLFKQMCENTKAYLTDYPLEAFEV